MNSVSNESEETKSTDRRDSWGIELGNLGRRTRFQVNRVGDVEEGVPLRNNREDNNTVQINGDLSTQDDDDQDSEEEDYDDGRSPYDTKYAKSFRHLTREALPRLDNYRNVMSLQAAYRPTLDELHNPPNTDIKHQQTQVIPDEPEGLIKFGWIQGVLIRNLLNIWGVMLFLRLSWVVAEAGIGQGCLLILATSCVTIITSLSMSAISTNGVIKGGGTYYMISRSLGPEFGGSIGLIFSLANAVACAMYVVGFCESLQSLLTTYDLSIIDGATQDMRVLGSITIIILLGIVIIGMEWEAKTQLVLLVILVIAIIDFLIGAIIGPKSDLERARGFVGFDAHLLNENFKADYRPFENVEHNFFSVLSIFFPAATGILAGANISGDLRDPQSAIPKGTLLSIAITTASYLVMAVFSGATMQRDASGNLEDLLTNNISCVKGECKYGLHNSFSVMELVSGFGPIIYAGCFAATLSSALASLVSAPKVFQALCKDKLYPKIDWFAKGYGKNNEPVRGYILTFFIATAFILIGNLNSIAPLISNFFLAAYALINFSTFHASLAKPVGWRPMFRYYNMWLSLTGAILCVGVMFLISWWTALLTLAVVLALYLIVSYRKPVVNWGSTTQAQTYRTALTSVIQLMRVEDHVKNYRPQILVLTGFPGTRPALIDFAYLITKNNSLMLCGHIIDFNISQIVRNQLQVRAQSWLRSHRIKAFYTLIESTNFDEGARILGQVAGIGKLRPNIVLLGFKQDWRTCPREQLLSYFETIHKAMDIHLAVCILRVENGLDFSSLLGDPLVEITALSSGNAGTPPSKDGSGFQRNQSTQSFIPQSHGSSLSDLSSPVLISPKIRVPSEEENVKRDKNAEVKAELYRTTAGSKLEKHDLNKITQFICRQTPGTIDVWWLYDDGGLTLLLPYIINSRPNYRPCKLRVFTLANKKQELEFEQRSMASMLAKFRIDYSDLKVIPDITKKPQTSTTSFFESLIQDLKVGDESPKQEWNITEAELLAMNDKTNRHLRLREMMLESSHQANLIVMTLPMPRKNVVSAGLYLAWLEVLTKDMPPFLLVRGNQTSVLTFYS